MTEYTRRVENPSALSVMAVAVKACTRCRVDKPLSEFYASKKTLIGLQSWCKSCMREQGNIYNHSPEGKAKAAQYSQSEKKKEADRAYKRSERGRRVRAEYLASEAGQAMLRKFWTPGRMAAYVRRYLKTEKGKACLARYYASDKGQQTLRRGIDKRRSQQENLPVDFTVAMKRTLLERFEYRCAYCREHFIRKHRHPLSLTWDHLIPLSRSEFQNPGTVWGNMVPACLRCNSSKGTRTLEEYCSPQQSQFINQRIA